MRVPVCAALVVAGIAVSAQQPARPTFRAGVNAVVMDVRVVDRSGRFISDLTKEDFQVFEDGLEQPITTFDLVDLPPPPPALRSVGSFAPMSDVSTNVGLDEGRLYVIVLDDIFGHAPQVSPGLDVGFTTIPVTMDARLLAREVIFHMADSDRAAIVTTGGRRDMAQEFTNDKARLVATLDKYVANQGQDPYPPVGSGYTRSQPRQDEGADRRLEQGYGVRVGEAFLSTEHDAIKSLKDIAEWLAGVEGRRKAIVLISQRLGGIAGDLSLTNWSKRAGLQDLMTPYHIKNLIEATSRANVAIYTLNPVIRPGSDGTGITLPDEYVQAVAESGRSNTVVTIAQATGGFSRGLTFDGVFERIAAETGSYYLIGFMSGLLEDGKFHHVEVRTRRSDLGVRTRAGYVSSPRPQLSSSMIPRKTPLPLAEALQSPASMTGIPLSMSATAYRGARSKAFLSIVVELGDILATASDGEPPSTTPIELAIAAAQVNGKADDVRRIAVGGGTVVSQLAVKPGRYHVRVAALDTSSSRRGSLLYDLDVPDFSWKTLTMSGVVLASSPMPASPVAGSDQRWKDQFGVPPTTRRVFSRDEVLRSYVEVYDNSGSRASSVDVTATVRDTAGEIRLERHHVSAVQKANGRLDHLVRTEIPLDELPAGSFTLAIEAQRAGKNDRAVSRPVPFTVK